MNKELILEKSNKIKSELLSDMEKNTQSRLNEVMKNITNSNNDIDKMSLALSGILSFTIQESERYTVEYTNKLLEELFANEN